MLLETLEQIAKVLKTIIGFLNLPILLITAYATIVRVVESVNQLSIQPDVKSTWNKILQTIKNFGSVEKYEKENKNDVEK